MLKERVISALLGLPLLFYLIIKGGIWLILGIAIVSFIGINEYYNAFKNANYYPIKPFGLTFGVSIILSLSGYFLELELAIIFFFLLSGVYYIFSNDRNIVDWLITISGSFYVAYFLSTLLLIRNLKYGLYLIWVVFIVSWVTDTGAYFFGLSLGKHKLCPQISPKKSIEGSIGGLLTSAFAMYLYYLFLGSKMPEFGLEFFVITGIILSIISQLGDLLASKIKRFCNIKDFGNILPGHGGLLDRFDSIILCAPALYFILKVILR